ncbi:hypothetical protein [Pontibacter roseus]|uniref:hypothetical protein n=1 Tax=Pontibacter roseus TaxID=336989 RepID=UPI00035C539E|nr:hypothetical protein [Pontibacter roseus]
MEDATNYTASESTYTSIAKNLCYELSYSGLKNRVCFIIHGFWKSRENVPDLLNDWDKAIRFTRPGFTVITDMRTMITHPQSLNTLHEEAQIKVKQAGVLQVANIMPTDNIAKLQIGSLADKTLIPSRNFATVEEAEQWLDQLTPRLN